MSGWAWSWLGGLFSSCTSGPGGADLANITIDESRGLASSSTVLSATSEAATPIISLATIERQRRIATAAEERSELSAETEQIQQILSIVEAMRQRHPSETLTEEHLVSELRNILRITRNEEEDEDTTGQVGSTRKKEAGRLLSAIVVRNVLTWARRQGEQSDDSGGLVLALAAALNGAQQTELHGILQGLPPAVLGDEGAQEETRVFIDIQKDIREAQKLEQLKVERKQQLVEVVTGVIVELVQTFSPLIVCESKGKEKDETHGNMARVVASLISCVEEPDRVRLVMEQLLLMANKWLPNDHERRDERLRGVLSLSSQEASTPGEPPLILLPS